MQIKGKAIIKQCFCGKTQKHGEFVPITKEMSNNIKMFVEKGTAEIVRTRCPDCEKNNG